jgi:hypothetical protein
MASLGSALGGNVGIARYGFLECTGGKGCAVLEAQKPMQPIGLA